MAKTNSKKNNLIKAVFILAIFAFVFIFATQTAHAQEGGYMEGGIGAALQNFYGLITGTIYYIAGGLVALYLSTSALQWLINNQTTLIDFNNSFVTRGLQVTQSLADMLLLLAFVVAAFGIIFKLKEFEAKKTIGNLVMVAIATRFGPLAVKMIVDIGNVIINTIVGGNDQLLSQVTSVLMADMLNTVGTVAGVIAVDAVLLSVPWVNIFALGANLYSIGSAAAVAVGYDNIATNLAGNATLYFAVYYLVKMIFQLVVSYTLSGVYLIYIGLFASRIFMIQILTVISPLAIFSLALPQTKKYFGQWRDSLFKWTFVGIWTLFFLMLGIGSTGFVFPENPDFNSTLATGVFSGMGVDQYMLYYIFLIIFLSMVADMAQKDSGMGAGFKAAMMGVGMAGYAHVVKPAAGQIQGAALNKYSSAQARLESGKGGVSDSIIKHGAGLMANMTDDKRMSSWRSVFSGDDGSKATARFSDAKSFLKLSDAGSVVDSKIKKYDDEVTMEKAVAKGKDLNDMEAMSILKRSIAKKGEEANVSKILDSLNKDKKNPNRGDRIVDAMIARNRITPAQIKEGYLNGTINKTDKVVEAIVKQDYNGSALAKVQSLRGHVADNEADKKEEKEMQMLTLIYKDSAIKKNAFESLPESMFTASTKTNEDDRKAEDEENKKKRLALLTNASSRTLGNAMTTNKTYYDKLTSDISGMQGKDLENFAKTNPELLEQMAANPVQQKSLPSSLRDNNGEIDSAKLSELIGKNIQGSKSAAPETTPAALGKRKSAFSRPKKQTIDKEPPAAKSGATSPIGTVFPKDDDTGNKSTP
ncbi:MAG: hypothetical protein WCX69_02935 [Candidatus Paceibacterota bacterium]